MAIFTGFKPKDIQKIANKLGYEGSLDNFENYLEQNPEKKRQMIVYEESAKQMARGGVVKMQEGGTTSNESSTTPTIGGVTADKDATTCFNSWSNSCSTM